MDVVVVRTAEALALCSIWDAEEENLLLPYFCLVPPKRFSKEGAIMRRCRITDCFLLAR